MSGAVARRAASLALVKRIRTGPQTQPGGRALRSGEIQRGDRDRCPWAAVLRRVQRRADREVVAGDRIPRFPDPLVPQILHLPGRGVDEDVFDVDEELTEPLLAPEPRERRGEVTLIEVGSVMPGDEPRARRLDGRAERLARINAHVVSASNERSRQGANGVDVPRERHRREQEAGHATQDAPRNRIPPPGASQTARPPQHERRSNHAGECPQAGGPLRASPDCGYLAGR